MPASHVDDITNFPMALSDSGSHRCWTDADRSRHSLPSRLLAAYPDIKPPMLIPRNRQCDIVNE